MFYTRIRHQLMANNSLFEFQDVSVFIYGLAVVSSLSKSSLRSERLIFSMVNSTDKSRAARFRARNKMHGHDTLDPFAAGELQHIVSSCVAACSRGDVLLGHHTLNVHERISGRNDVKLVDKGLDILHASFKIVDGVLVLQLEVTLVVVNSCYNVTSEFPQRHEHILVTPVEKIKASDGVNFALLPSLGKAGLQAVDLFDEARNLLLEFSQDISIQESHTFLDFCQTFLADGRSSLLVEFLEDFAEGSLVQFQKVQEQLQFAMESSQRFLSVDVLVEVLGGTHSSISILEPFVVSRGGKLSQGLLQINDSWRRRRRRNRFVIGAAVVVRQGVGARTSRGHRCLSLSWRANNFLGIGSDFTEGSYAIFESFEVVKSPPFTLIVESGELFFVSLQNAEKFLGYIIRVLETFLQSLVRDVEEEPLVGAFFNESLSVLHGFVVELVACDCGVSLNE